MLNTFKTTALAALVGFGAIAAPAAAQADTLYFGFDDRGAHIAVDDDDDREYRRRDRDWRHDDRDWRRDDRRERRCTPERALDKAERLGLRRARIVDVDRRTIEVRGRKHGERVTVVFARAPRCPVIGW